jgi:hypothetical protein
VLWSQKLHPLCSAYQSSASDFVVVYFGRELENRRHRYKRSTSKRTEMNREDFIINVSERLYVLNSSKYKLQF